MADDGAGVFAERPFRFGRAPCIVVQGPVRDVGERPGDGLLREYQRVTVDGKAGVEVQEPLMRLELGGERAEDLRGSEGLRRDVEAAQ